MNKFFKLLMALFVCATLFVFTVPAQAAYDHYQIYVYADTGYATAAGGYTSITSGVRYIVFDGGGAKTKSTLYSDSAGTAKTNPVEAATFGVLDRIDFYIDNTVTTVDIAIMTLDGYSTWLRGATTSTRTVIIDKKPGMHMAFADWDMTLASMNGLTGTATDYWTFDSDIVLLPNIFTEVITATSVCDVQLFGQLSGTAGALFNYHPVDGAKVITGISTFYGATDSQTIGSVFATEPCTADVRTYPDPGKPYLVGTGETMTFSAASLLEEGDADDDSSNDTTVAWGFYHFWFIKLR